MTAQLDTHQIATSIADSPLLGELSAPIQLELSTAFQRIDIPAGQELFRDADPADALYLVLSGRVRVQSTARSESQSSELPLAELGKGDVFGEIALLTGDPRSATAVAVRDSHLARLDRASFDRLVAAHPAELLGLFSRHLARRLRDSSLRRAPASRPPVAITVLPLSPAEQQGSARDFTAELVRQLSAFGPTLHLNREVIDRIVKPIGPVRPHLPIREITTIAAQVAERRLLAWLDDLERLYRHVVYEADYQSGIEESDWTSRCLRQADVLLVVAGGSSDPAESEKTMVRLNRKALPSVKSTLVLIHPETRPASRSEIPPETPPETPPAEDGAITHTALWKRALGFTAHEHVRRHPGGQHHPMDVGRIARALNGQSVGLALGGGFALGLAHIGVVDAMRELEIPIDFVGGTSMGAIIAAACALHYSHDQMLEVMDQGCAQALKGDYTLPIVSLLTGKKVTAALGKYLEHVEIEDMHLPYFAISASLVHARMIVHRTGNALRSVLASCRAPGMFPPLGWAGDVLVDGGLVNNIPADVMRSALLGREGNSHGTLSPELTTGGGTVFAIDVSPPSEFTAGAEFGMDLSGWKVGLRNLNPFRKRQRIGTIADVLMRLIRMGGVAHNQQIRDSADLYLSMHLEGFSVRDFARGEELAQAGYRLAHKELNAWIAANGRPWLGAVSQPVTASARPAAKEKGVSQ